MRALTIVSLLIIRAYFEIPYKMFMYLRRRVHKQRRDSYDVYDQRIRIDQTFPLEINSYQVARMLGDIRWSMYVHGATSSVPTTRAHLRCFGRRLTR